MINKEFDICKPFGLYTLIYGLILRDKTITHVKPDNTHKDGSLFHLNICNVNDEYEEIDCAIIDSEGIKFDYIKQLPSIENSISEPEMFKYFYYFGKIIGRLTFYHLFNRKTELFFNEKEYVRTKTAFDMMFESLNPFINKYEEVMNNYSKNIEGDSLVKNNFFMELDSGFSIILNKISKISERTSIDIPISTLMAISYISLTYTLIGLIGMLKSRSNTISYYDFINKVSQDISIDDILKNLIFRDGDSEDSRTDDMSKFDALVFTFKVLSDFYAHSPLYGMKTSSNITYKALYFLGERLEKQLISGSENIENLSSEEVRRIEIFCSIVSNAAFNIKQNIMSFCNFSNYIEPEEVKFGLSSDCDIPIVYLETFTKLLYIPLVENNSSIKEETIENSNLSYSIVYEDELKSRKNDEHEVSFKDFKMYVEKLLHDESITIVSPKTIFKLIYMLSFARLYLYDKSKIKFCKVKDDQYIMEFIAIGEVAIYYFFQEWFNRKDKVYRFERRVYNVETEKYLTFYDPLKFEIVIILVDYLRMIFSFHNDYQSILSFLYTNELTYILNNEYEFDKDKYLKLNKYIKTISHQLERLISNEKYGIDMVIEPEKGKIGLIFLLLSFMSKDIIIDILMNKTKIVNFIEKLKDVENKDLIIQILEKLKCKEEIVGFCSNDKIYCKINTCIREIFEAPLNVYQKFYLIYCLNYQYIREDHSQFIACELNSDESKNMIILDREKYLNEEKGLMTSLEEILNKVIENSNNDSKITYGFDL